MNPDPENALEHILQEQAELKRRLAELDRRIEEIAATPTPPAPAPVDAAPKKKQRPGRERATAPPAPPPLPLVPAAAETAPPSRETPASAPVAVPQAPRKSAPATSGVPGGIEFKLGTYWLVRIGVVMLLTGLVFLANYFVFSDRISASIKVAALYAGSFALLGGGIWIERKRESLRNYGQVLAAGGLAAVYFTTFAAHKFPALAIITSPLLAGVLLLLWAGFMVFLADRKKSETLAIMGVLLAYYTLIITGVSLFSLWSALILSGVALAFLLRNRWIVVGFVSMAGTYLAFAYWRFPHLLEWLREGAPTGGTFWPAYGFLICYWAVFTAAAFLTSPAQMKMARRSAFAGLNNGGFLLLFGLGVARHFPDRFWLFSLVAGAVALMLYGLAGARFGRGNLLSDIFLTKGLVLVTLAFVIKLSGVSLALVLAAESCVLLVFGLRRKNGLLEAGAYFSATFAVFYILYAELKGPGQAWFLEYPGDIAGFAAFGVALFLFFNAWWVRRCDFAGGEKTQTSLEPRAGLFVGLGIGAAAFGALWDLPESSRAFGFIVAGVAAAAAGSIRRVNLPELALFGQVFSIAGIFSFVFRNLIPSQTMPLYFSVPVLLAILGLVHWAAHERALPAEQPRRNLFQYIFAAGFSLAVVVFSLERLAEESHWLWIGGLAALTQLVYGVRTKAVALSAFSPLYAAAVWVVFFAERHHAFAGALSIALFCAYIFLLGLFRENAEAEKSLNAMRRGVLQAGLFVLRVMVLSMFIFWIHRHLGESWQPLAIGAAAFALFVLSFRHADWQRLIFSLVLVVISSASLVVKALESPGSWQWQWYLATLVPLAMQRHLRRIAGKGKELPVLSSGQRQGLHIALAAVGIALVWFLLSADVDAWRSGFYLAVSWSLLAAGVFAAGYFLEERLYRLFSLAILGAALLRILVVDVWALDQLARIVSFIVIGLVLLTLGFIYTRFQERLRRYF